MKKINLYLFLILIGLGLNACKDYVTNVDPLINQIADNRLNDPTQLPFLIKGVETQFANETSLLNVLADGLSDQFIFSLDVRGATYPSYIQIDAGDITFDNNSVRTAYDGLGNCRFLADNLIKRTNSENVTDSSLKKQALFTGEFYGAYARYQYATYFGLNITQGGSPINGGSFIPSSQLYDDAIAKFKTALTLTTDASIIRVINSLIARAYLYKGDYANSASYAQKGMQSGDAALEALHNIQQANSYYWEAGTGRTQFCVDSRFHDYVVTDPNEANRIPLLQAPAVGDVVYYHQDKYPSYDSGDILMTWQENNLMLAELALRGQTTGDPAALVNEVRSSHNIDSVNVVTLDDIYVERDKELFVTGNRLPDQRRFNSWHLTAGTWEYLPITDDERNSNPNL